MKIIKIFFLNTDPIRYAPLKIEVCLSHKFCNIIITSN